MSLKEKESDDLLYTVWSLVMVRVNQLLPQEVKVPLHEIWKRIYEYLEKGRNDVTVRYS